MDFKSTLGSILSILTSGHMSKQGLKNEHKDRVNNVIKKLHAQITDMDIAETQNKFWKECNMFKNEDGVYEKW